MLLYFLCQPHDRLSFCYPMIIMWNKYQSLEKCIYEAVILDLGDAVNGLYDILKKCSKVYTLYIDDETAQAKLKQYEENLRTAGYADVLEHTVKKQAGVSRRRAGQSGAV